MRSRAAAIALLVAGVLAALGGFAVMLLSGFLALLINPHGGLYGGTREEIATATLVAVVSGLVGVGGFAAALGSALFLSKLRAQEAKQRVPGP